MGAGPALLGIAPLLCPAILQMGQTACAHSVLCVSSSGDATTDLGIPSFWQSRVQPMGGMGLTSWAALAPAFLKLPLLSCP